MTDLNEKALEAAILAMSEVDASSRGGVEARQCLEAAIPAYLSALVQDEAAVERVARAMADYLGDSLWDDYEGQARAALSALLKAKDAP